MSYDKKISYLISEASYYTRLNLTGMVRRMRPFWNSLGYCENSAQISLKVKQNPDFIMADTHLSDGSCLGTLKAHASHLPTILFTQTLTEKEARKELPNVLKFIYLPFSQEEMEEAILLVEARLYNLDQVKNNIH